MNDPKFDLGITREQFTRRLEEVKNAVQRHGRAKQIVVEKLKTRSRRPTDQRPVKLTGESDD